MTRRARQASHLRTTSPPHRAPDPVLPLTVSQANRLRSLVRSTLSDLHVDAVVPADHASDDQGREFGLWNLAADLRMLPERGVVARGPAAVRDPARPCDARGPERRRPGPGCPVAGHAPRTGALARGPSQRPARRRRPPRPAVRPDGSPHLDAVRGP